MSDRGMKKWAPYKSLNKQYEDIHLLRENRNKVTKPQISSDEAEIINDILTNYDGEELNIKYYRNGKILSYEGTLLKIDSFERKIKTMDSTFIHFNELISINIQ